MDFRQAAETFNWWPLVEPVPSRRATLRHQVRPSKEDIPNEKMRSLASPAAENPLSQRRQGSSKSWWTLGTNGSRTGALGERSA